VAKKIRAARHYQKPDDRARALAEHAIPHVRSVVRSALGHIAMHGNAHIREMVRIGKPADQIAAAALPRTMWQDALAETFSALTDVWRLGGMLGAEKITSTFRKAGRMVDFRKYDPDQERDDRGRWTSGGSTGTQAPGVASPGSSTSAWGARLAHIVDNTARHLSFNPKNITISQQIRTFVLNGKSRNMAGEANLKTGTITIYQNHADEQTAQPLIAHEVEHVKFQSYLNEVGGQANAFNAEVKGMPRDAVRNPDGTLRPPYDTKYPMLQQGIELMDNKSRELISTDGITPYSKDWWKAYQKGNATVELAAHETLAEIAAVHVDTGSVKGSMAWRRLYRAVNQRWVDRGSKFF
jgi:hypothetical protein